MPPPFGVQPDSAKSKPDSNPIEHVPAQFNAFYPQCSGSNVRLASALRAGAQRIES
jgi:hypothetical protein